MDTNIIDPSNDLEKFINLSSLVQDAFSECTSLVRIKFPEQITNAMIAMRNCPSLEVIDVNENCENLVFATNCLFNDYNLRSLILRPKKVVPLRFSHFYKKLFFYTTVHENFRIYVPDEVYSDYLSDSEWGAEEEQKKYILPLSVYSPMR